jgi:uncharacterized protein (TIGR02996 family)
MQTEAEAFLQRIRAYPDDDAQRLIFADWLDEEGDPRGQFIRVQLAIAALPVDDPARRNLQGQEQALLDAHREGWEAPLRGLATGLVFRRGFVEEMKVEAKQFLRHADQIFTASPVRHITLLDVSETLPTVFQSPYLGRLSALTVKNQHTGDALAQAAARSEHLAGLKRLTLTRNRLGDDAAEQLAASPHLTNLEELDLSENEVGETGARAIAASQHLAKLRRLELRQNRLGPAGAEAVAGSERLASLHQLGLSDNDVGLPRLASLAHAHNMLRVPVLDLSANGLTPPGLQAALYPPAGAGGAVRLTELDLSANELGDDGARLLAKSPHLAKLTVLKLANCGIGDSGARALAGCPHLNEVAVLALENNPVGDSGLSAFLDSRHWRSLRQILVPRIGVSERIRKDLVDRFNRPRRG